MCDLRPCKCCCRCDVHVLLSKSNPSVSAQAFPEENAAVQLQLVTAAVKLFLKCPQQRAQQMIQLVLTYATQVRRTFQTILS